MGQWPGLQLSYRKDWNEDILSVSQPCPHLGLCAQPHPHLGLCASADLFEEIRRLFDPINDPNMKWLLSKASVPDSLFWKYKQHLQAVIVLQD